VKLDSGGCVYGAGVLVKHLRGLEKEFEGVREGHADIEYIHRMRVASRRLRATLPLFGDCLPKKRSATWNKQIRAITSALGAARDADVQIQNLDEFRRKQSDHTFSPGLNRLLLRLRQKRDRLQPGLVKALDELRAAGTLADMLGLLEPQAARAEGVYLYTPALYTHAFGAITSRLDELLAFDPIVNQAEKVSELHAMRIAAKWLRYTLEAFSPLYGGELKEWLQAVRAAQDDLGEIHDCDVWGDFVPRFLEKERRRILDYLGHTRPYPRLVAGIEAYAAARLLERGGHYEHFKGLWAEWKEQELWERLGQAVQTPGAGA